MRRMIMTALAGLTLAGIAGAQTQYSDGLPLLKRRPFAPGAEFSPPPPTEAPPAPIIRGPIYSPYSMIHYGWLPSVHPIETLPLPATPFPTAPSPSRSFPGLPGSIKPTAPQPMPAKPKDAVPAEPAKPKSPAVESAKPKFLP
jgi:hypothetical protein